MPLPSSAMVTVRRVSQVSGVLSAGWSVSVSIAMWTLVAPARREFYRASVITSESVLA